MKVGIDIPDDALDALSERIFERLRPILTPSLPNVDDDVLDVPGLAKYLKITQQRVYDAVSAKEIPYFTIGRYIRFRRTTIDKWIQEQSIPVVSPAKRRLALVQGNKASD